MAKNTTCGSMGGYGNKKLPKAGTGTKAGANGGKPRAGTGVKSGTNHAKSAPVTVRKGGGHS